MTDFPSLRGQGMISIDVETYDPDLKTNGPGYHRGSYVVGVAVGTEAGYRKYYPVAHEGGGNLDKSKVVGWLNQELSSDAPKVGANLIYDLGFLEAMGVSVKGPFYDIQVAEPLIDENRLSYSLENVSQSYLGVGKTDDELDSWLVEHFGKKNPKGNIWRAPAHIVAPYAEGDVDLPLRIFAKQKPILEQQGLWDLFVLESKLIPMLLRMRQRGVRVDLSKAEEMYDSFTKKQASLMEDVRRACGKEDASVWAAKDLAVIFDSYGISYPRTPKTKAPSITSLWLDRCEHPVAQTILEIRKIDKLRETFLKGCILERHYNGRIHCLFHQLKSDTNGTVSGRLSCVAPWTPVVTRRGTIPIIEVRIGDEVFTHMRRWRKVTHTWMKGYDMMYDVYLSNGQVLTCTGKHRVYIEELDVRSKERSICSGAMSNDESKGNRQEAEHDASQCFRSIEELLDSGRASGFVLVKPFPLEDGRQESYEREIFRKAPCLEGRDTREEWIHDDLDSRGEDPVSSVCLEEHRGVRHTPHRRGSEQQRRRQFSHSNEEGSPSYPCPPESRSVLVKIEKIEPSGYYGVIDITVEEDSTYLACGVFSHNSSLPNLQFIPARTAEGKMVRKLFLPDEDQDFYKLDFSQIEYRLMVHDAATLRLPGAQEVVDRYTTDSTVDFHQVVAEMTGLSRSAAKTVNFGIAYGEGVAKLCASLGLSQQEGEKLLEEYHSRAPFMRPLSRRVSHLAASQGVITTILGRRRRFDSWAIVNRAGETTILKQRVPGAKRAFTHKALNARIQGSAADIMKKSMVDVYESGVIDVLGIPQLTVHDELDGSVPRTREGREAMEELKNIMESCVKLKVPLKVDGGTGPNWGEVE